MVTRYFSSKAADQDFHATLIKLIAFIWIAKVVDEIIMRDEVAVQDQFL